MHEKEKKLDEYSRLAMMINGWSPFAFGIAGAPETYLIRNGRLIS